MNNQEVIFDDDKVYRCIPYGDDTCKICGKSIMQDSQGNWF